MVLVPRFLWSHNHKSAKDTHINSDDDVNNTNNRSLDMNQSKTPIFVIDRSWKRLFTSKQNKEQWVPTLSGIIKAGDEGVYSSALFNNLQAHPGEMDLETLLDVFRTASKTHSMTAKPTYTPDISKFIADTRTRHRRTQSMKVNKESRPESLPRQRNSMDLVERGLSRSRSRRVKPVLVSAFDHTLPAVNNRKSLQPPTWTQNVQRVLYIDGKAVITVTPAELEALSIIIGNPITLRDANQISQTSPLTSGQGAYGISIHQTTYPDGTHRITLYQHKRGISQLASRGSGYSPLLAKHLAGGSLPLSRNSSIDNTILITSTTIRHIQSGNPLQLNQITSSTPASSFLYNVPHANPPIFHTLLPTTPPSPSSSTSLLLETIAALPFTGGLVPHASTPLIRAIHFIASAGLPPARLLQRLEALVDKVHRHSPDLQLFGPLLLPQNAGLLFRERERLGKLATGSTAVQDTLADKVARMHRYTTMLERLMALIPSSSGSAQSVAETRQAVMTATMREIERSYADAVAAFHSPSPSPSIEQIGPKTRTKTNPVRHASGSSHGTKRSSSSSLTAPTSPVSMDVRSPRASSTFPVLNLGKQLEAVLKTELPFGVETVAMVARLVLVAWTISVEGVDWESGEGLGFGGRDVGQWTMG